MGNIIILVICGLFSALLGWTLVAYHKKDEWEDDEQVDYLAVWREENK